MTDTTITITPEERAAWLKDAQPKSVGHYEPIDFETDKRIRRLLTALEAAEKRAEKAEKELAGADAEIDSLQDQLTDCECTENEAPHILCDIARMVGVYEHCQELGDDIGDTTIEAVQTLIDEKQKAEAERDRMRAALTPSPETKAAYTAEVRVDEATFVPWVAIKEIMALIRGQAGIEKAAWNSLPRRPDYNDVDCAGCPERRRSALMWTTEPPKVAGWYWWRTSKGQNVNTIQVWSRSGVLGYCFDTEFITTLDRGEWAGPIPTPIEPEAS